MKKGIIVFTTIIIVLSLAGCSSSEMSLMNKSGILEDADYQEYQSLENAGELNESGEYVFEDGQNETTDLNASEGSVHVTFADNRNLNIEYFRNESMTESIDVDSCYLNPGDSIYARLLGIDNKDSDEYELSVYRIVQIYEDGSRMTIIENKAETNGLVFEINNDFEGTELSVIPLGNYLRTSEQNTEPETETQIATEETETTTEESTKDNDSIIDFFIDLFNGGK